MPNASMAPFVALSANKGCARVLEYSNFSGSHNVGASRRAPTRGLGPMILRQWRGGCLSAPWYRSGGQSVVSLGEQGRNERSALADWSRDAGPR